MEQQKEKLKFGIEIEGIFNSKIHSFDPRGYHSDDEDEEVGNYWKVEHDGSISRDRTFEFETCAEFISDILKGEEGVKQGLDDFIEELSKDGEYSLSEVIYFNRSCGCHIHLGLESKRFYKLIDFGILKKMRELFFEELEKSKVIGESAKKLIKMQYFRDYAKKSTKQKYLNQSHRQMEFNTHSEINGYGLEWRSFNLMGIKSWDELREMFIIMLKCADFLKKTMFEGYTLRKQALIIKRQQLKDEYEKSKLFEQNLNIKYKEEEISDLYFESGEIEEEIIKPIEYLRVETQTINQNEVFLIGSL